ncbi:MAG: tetratricopeptide repeat protein [Bacteroidia bacterium]|nr:tetratricopeptide repeat protein [Bacteroidia bacterium]MDW8089448.1 tetratricopeptide repeat protein [Bacteroidia bacterium]
MRWVWIGVLTFLGVGRLEAQVLQQIDSLEQLLRRQRIPDSVALATYITLSKLYLNINEWRALDYARRAEPLARRLGDKRRELLSLYYQASALYYAASYEQATRLLGRADTLFRAIPADTGILVQMLNLQAALAESMGDLLAAQGFYERSLTLAQSIRNSPLEIMTRINMGGLYRKQRLYELAEEQLMQAITQAEKAKEAEYLRNALKELFLLHLAEGRVEEALAVQARILALARQSGIQAWLWDAYGFALCEAARAKLPQADTLLQAAEREIQDPISRARLYNWVAAEGFYQTGSLARAKDLYQKALELAEAHGDTTLAVQVLLNLGNLYTRQALYPQAMERLLRARRLCELRNDSTLLPMVLNAIGEIYYNQEEWDKALELFSYAADYANLAPNPTFPFKVATNLAVAQAKKGNIEAARNLFRESRILAEESEDWGSAAEASINLARLEMEQAQLDSAAHHLEIALRYAKRSRSDFALAHVLMNKGDLFWRKKQPKMAIAQYEEAREILEPLEAYSELAEVYDKLIILYGETRAHAQGYRYIQPLIHALQRVSNEENVRALTSMELNYLHQKEKDMQERRIEAERLRAEKARQVTWIIVLSAFLLIGAAAIVLVVLYRANRREREINAQLAERNRLIEEQKNLLEEKNEALAKAKQDIEESILYARRIQMAILPDLTPFYNRFPESFVLYLPKDVVSGDFYYFYPLSPTESLLAVADCTGHGVPGAFMSMIGTTLLNRLAQEEGPKNPSLLLERLDEELRYTLHQTLSEGQVKDGMDIALCYIDLQRRELHFAGARRPLFLFTPEGEFIEIKGSRRSIGGDQLLQHSAFESHLIPLRPNLSFYLFSDGIVDQQGFEKRPDGTLHRSKFLPKRLREILARVHGYPPQQQRQIIEETILAWRGNIEQMDDICLIGVRYTG